MRLSTPSRFPKATRPAWRISTYVLIAGALVGSALTGQAATFTRGATGATDSWSTGANWSGVPISDPTTTLTYAGTLAASFGITSTNDIAGDFQLNRLSITYAGTTTAGSLLLTGNRLEFVTNAGTLPTLNFGTGTPGPTVSIANNLLLTNNLTVTAASAADLSGIISGGGSLSKTGSTSLVTLSGANTLTGAISIGTAGSVSSSGTLGVTGLNGSLNTATGYAIHGVGSQLALTYVAGGSLDRLSDTAGVTLSTGAELKFNSITTAATPTTETFGTLTLGTGAEYVTLAQTGTGANSLGTYTSAGFSRGSNLATAMVRGPALGNGTTTATRLVFTSTAGLTQVGTSTSSTGVSTGTVKDLTIIPYLLGDISATGTGTNFVTYDTASGIRLLGANEQTTLAAGSTTAATHENVKGAAVTLTASTLAVNSLLLATTLLMDGTSTALTVDSGAIAALGTTTSTLGSGFSSITLGNGEGVVTASTATTIFNINAPIGVTSGGGLTKAGLGMLVLGAANTYTGATTINQGTLQVGNGTTGSINSGSAITVTPQGTLSLNLANNGVLSNAITNSGTITKLAGANVNELSSNISGTGVLTMNLTGATLALSGSNSYSGATAITAGTLSLAGVNGTTGTTSVTGGTLQGVATVANITTPGGVTTSSAFSPLTYVNLTPSLSTTTNGVVDLRANASTTFSTLGLTYTGNQSSARTATINVDRTASGTLSNQTITIAGDFGVMGASGAGTNTINFTGGNGYKLAFGGTRVGLNADNVTTFNSTDTDVAFGILTNGSGATVNGSVLGNYNLNLTFSGNSAYTVAGQNVTTGSRSQALTFAQTGSGSTTLLGTATGGNGLTYNLNSGTLNVNNVNALGSGTVAHTLNIAGGTLDNTNGGLVLTNGTNKLALNMNGDFTYGGTGALNMGTGAISLGTAAGTTRAITANGTQALTLGGVIANGTTATALAKNGPGTLILTGVSTFTGGASVSAGTLLVNGAGSLASAVSVSGAGTLGGTGGSVPAVTALLGGTVAPGSSIGQFNAASVDFAAGSFLSIELNPTLLTTDLLNISGTLNLAGTNNANLTLSLIPGSDTALSPGQVFTIVDYGTWNGGLFTLNGNLLADDSLVTVGLNQYLANYNNGTAFTLTTTAVPEPSTCLLLASGLALVARRRRRYGA